MALVMVGNTDWSFNMKHTCPECGHVQYSAASYASEPTRERLVIGTWNHNCFECGCKPMQNCYVDENDKMITINEILGEDHVNPRKTVIGSVKGYW